MVSDGPVKYSDEMRTLSPVWNATDVPAEFVQHCVVVSQFAALFPTSVNSAATADAVS
jgi:hypothetical protein